MTDSQAIIAIAIAFLIGYHAGNNKYDKCTIELTKGNQATVFVGKYHE